MLRSETEPSTRFVQHDTTGKPLSARSMRTVPDWAFVLGYGLPPPRRSTSFPHSDPPDSSVSPLRYPGGKFRAVKSIRQYFPEDIRELAAPFLGGGNVELACAADGMKVYGADAFGPLINFWKQVQNDPVLVTERVKNHFPLERKQFYAFQKRFFDMEDPVEQAAVFFVLNRSSFSGATLSGGMSQGHPRFNRPAIKRLRNFRSRNLSVCCADYRSTIRKHPDKFLYLDPPYANNERLYGKQGSLHKRLNHEELAEELKQRSGWALSYNDDPLILKVYGQYRIEFVQCTYGMSNGKQSYELLIMDW